MPSTDTYDLIVVGAGSDVAPAFDAIGAQMTPRPMQGAHPLTRALRRLSRRVGRLRASHLWAADASVMPTITSANTNAPSIMIGHRAAEFIAKDAA